MKKIYSLFLSLILVQSLLTQALISDSLIGEATASELSALGFPDAIYDVNVYKIVYSTLDGQGETTIASGAVAIPQVDCALPALVYCHGTVFLKSDVPSNFNSEGLLGTGVASYGYLTILPDYLGLGESPGMHPYVHAATEGEVSFHMIRATEQFCLNENVTLNSQLFVTGYSQGGHASMALVKYIEEYPLDDFTLNLLAAVCGSGPYDLSGTQTEMVLAEVPYGTGAYLPYVVFGYQSVYGNLFQTPDDILISPYDANLPPLFDGLHSGGQIQANMPSIPNDILIPSVLEELNAGTHVINTALADNDLHDWAPVTSVRMTYCTGDEQVDYVNSLIAQETMAGNGAMDATAVMLGTGNHGACFEPYAAYLFNWFGELKEDCVTSTVEILNEPEIIVYPNPTLGQLLLSFNNSGNENPKIILYNALGKIVNIEVEKSGSNEFILHTESLQSGSYYLTMRLGNDLVNKSIIVN